MCGFAGFLSPGSFDVPTAEKQLKVMCDAIVHRGPDDDGYWIDATHNIGLGHRRLSVLEISALGSQPMASKSGRWMLVFNGEIYNHRAVRKSLEARSPGLTWNGHSDTETLLAGFDSLGISETLKLCVGMFSIAVWDRKTMTLTLGRDRLGEKPLYYGWMGSGANQVFLFGSDLAALKVHQAFVSEIDRDALCSFLRFSCVVGENSIYLGIRKVKPGTLLSLSVKDPTPIETAYWSSLEIFLKGFREQFSGSYDDSLERIESLLTQSVHGQMLSDVPLGAFLSGGIDSSVLCALMQSVSMNPIKTFSIGFEDPGYNEAIFAKDVATHLGTDHTELYVSSNTAMNIIPKLSQIYSEPFADSSQIPTFLVSELARQNVTVGLSGDGGDEVFCGYNRYQVTDNMWPKIQYIPLNFRSLIARSINRFSPNTWDRFSKVTGQPHFGEKMRKMALAMISSTVDDLYRKLTSQWHNPESVVLGGNDSRRLSLSEHDSIKTLGSVEGMMALDSLTYLPDDILVKVDRAAMANSLETRAPFLDHRLIEFSWTLPIEFKLRHGVTKAPLRDILYRHVPKALIDRPKMGFAVPIGEWIRGPLRGWVEDLINEKSLIEEGFFHVPTVREAWSEHLSGRRNHDQRLWCILMFQSWYRAQKM